jgi:quercetin dioxygenase-like cupin family protein
LDRKDFPSSGFFESAIAGVRLAKGCPMNKPRLIAEPTCIEAVGTLPKLIEEFVGRVNTDTASVSIARMKSPPGWEEPGQTPAFDEYSIVLNGVLRVTTRAQIYDVRAGQAFVAPKGVWVRYATPEGAEYIAVCAPAFSPDIVHRDS